MNSFIRKLRHGARLTDGDETALDRLVGPVHRVGRGDIQPEGVAPRTIFLVLEGWACRYKQLETGKRQVTALYLPGDLCEPFGAVPPLTDCALGVLAPVTLARVTPGAMREAAAASLRIEEALWWDLLLADAIGREHMVSLGRRSATERLGHLFCELQVRLAMVDLVKGTSFAFPLTQSDLADLLGLSAVHVNRSLQELRASGLLSLRDRWVTIHDGRSLRELSMFDPAYLPANTLART